MRPNLTDLSGAINYNDIYDVLLMLNLAIYTPSILSCLARWPSTST